MPEKKIQDIGSEMCKGKVETHGTEERWNKKDKKSLKKVLTKGDGYGNIAELSARETRKSRLRQ